MKTFDNTSETFRSGLGLGKSCGKAVYHEYIAVGHLCFAVGDLFVCDEVIVLFVPASAISLNTGAASRVML